MDKKATAIVSYFTWIGWVVAYAIGDREGAKFHLNQSLVLKLAGIILSTIVGAVSAVFGWIPVIGQIIAILMLIAGTIGGLVLFVFWILGLIAAIQDEEKMIPVIGAFQIIK